MTDLTIGFHPSMPDEVYHRPRLGVVSKSALDRIRSPKTPAHYYAWATGQATRRDTPALHFGKAGHCAFFEPDEFSRRYVVEPDFGDCRFKENKQRRDAWREENQGREHLTAADGERIEAIRKSLHSHELIRRLLHQGEPELALVWRDETGLLCKSKDDYRVKRFSTVVDLKLVEDASPSGFAKSVARYSYHVQDALYRDGHQALGAPIEHFVFAAVEKAAPYASAVYTLDAEGIARGYQSARRDIDLLASCLRDNDWPGYPPGINTIQLPPWAE